MQIRSFIFNRNQENTYVVSDEQMGICSIIDCGCSKLDEFRLIKNYINDCGMSVANCLHTHLHFDHMFGAKYCYEEYGVRPKACLLEKDILEWNKMASLFMELTDNERLLLNFDNFDWIEHQEKISFGSVIFEILYTPGHTPGSISFWCPEKKVLFSGDLIFKNGFGRTDFDYGDKQQMSSSLRNIASLNLETLIFPGHGGMTQLDHELININKY